MSPVDRAGWVTEMKLVSVTKSGDTTLIQA